MTRTTSLILGFAAFCLTASLSQARVATAASPDDGSIHHFTDDGSIHHFADDGSIHHFTDDGSIHHFTDDGSIHHFTK
jgi:hypothetical protein